MLEQGLEPAAGTAADASRRCGTPRPTSGARTRSTCSPTAAGPSAACAPGTARPGSSPPTAASWSALVDRMGLRPVRWCCRQPRLAVHRQRVRRLRPRQRDHRRQRPAPAGPDDRPRHRRPASGSTATRSCGRVVDEVAGRTRATLHELNRAEIIVPEGSTSPARSTTRSARCWPSTELDARASAAGARLGLRAGRVRQGHGQAEEGAARRRWATTAC